MMNDYEVAVFIVGYRKRINEQLRIARQASFWAMLPHVKKESLNTAKDLGRLPDESEDDEQKETAPKTLEELKALWGD